MNENTSFRDILKFKRNTTTNDETLDSDDALESDFAGFDENDLN